MKNLFRLLLVIMIFALSVQVQASAIPSFVKKEKPFFKESNLNFSDVMVQSFDLTKKDISREESVSLIIPKGKKLIVDVFLKKTQIVPDKNNIVFLKRDQPQLKFRYSKQKHC